MPQPDTLTASLGMLQITATEKGYTVVDAETGITHFVRDDKLICAATNMQRAMLRAAQIMEEQEDAADGKAATEALQSGEPVHDWNDVKGFFGAAPTPA